MSLVLAASVIPYLGPLGIRVVRFRWTPPPNNFKADISYRVTRSPASKNNILWLERTLVVLVGKKK